MSESDVVISNKKGEMFIVELKEGL